MGFCICRLLVVSYTLKPLRVEDCNVPHYNFIASSLVNRFIFFDSLIQPLRVCEHPGDQTEMDLEPPHPLNWILTQV